VGDSQAQHTKTERYYFERFRELYPLPDGEIEFGDKPDVIVRGTRVVGCEVTNLYIKDGASPNGEQRQRRFRSRVIEKASSKYTQKGGPPIVAHVGFDLIRPQRSDILAEALSEFLLSHRPQQSGQVGRHLFEMVMPEVIFVYINVEPDADARWQGAQVFSQGLPDADRVADRLLEKIKAKEASALDYRACDAYILLVVADWIDPAQAQDIRLDDWMPMKSSVFEQGFLLDPHSPRLFPIIDGRESV
jgi:hypothetical protein